MSINFANVLIAAIGAMVVGGLWYSPKLFGNTWMKLSGISMEKMDESKKRGMWKLYLGQFVFSIISAYILAHFISLQGITDLNGAGALAFWIWLGFIVPILAGNSLWGGKSPKLFVLDGAQHLIALVVMSLILTLI